MAAQLLLHFNASTYLNIYIFLKGGHLILAIVHFPGIKWGRFCVLQVESNKFCTPFSPSKAQNMKLAAKMY
jgi:hypothetical protein